MKPVSESFCRYSCELLLILLLFLFASAFDIQAQDLCGQSPGSDQRSVVRPDLPESAAAIVDGTDQGYGLNHSAEAYMRSAINEEMRRIALSESSTASGPPTPSQGSTNNAYVFPSSHQRFKRYLENTVGPWTLIGIAGAAGIDQWDKNPPEWGQGASGYGKRFASDLGTNAIQQSTTYGLSEAFRLDSSFNKSTRNGFGPRLEDALLQNVTSRTRKGKRVISAPRLAGFYVGGLVATEAWYPSRFSYKDGLREGTYALAFGFATNVIEEFIFHR